MTDFRGGCLCGNVRYVIDAELRPITACHCTQCRKSSGHYGASTEVGAEALAVEGETLRWFESSPGVERGFCANCGSNLFWRRLSEPTVSVWAGTIDGPTGVRIVRNLYADFAGDYYDLPNVQP